ncbi:MAG: hypothetical protein ABJA84_03485 [Polaromonas sp.]
MSRLTEPPRHVPTLTDIVHPASTPEATVSADIAPAEISVETQELLVQRVMQGVDLMLERRLHDAIEQLILAHTKALMPRLREEIELLVRESVTHAFVRESALFPIQSKNNPLQR